MDRDKSKLKVALTLIEFLYESSQIDKDIYINILNEYKEQIDLSGIQCYAC